MGNICGKQEPDAFSQPGRVLGSAPPPQSKQTSSSVPHHQRFSGAGRTLSSAGGGGGSASSSHDAQDQKPTATEATRDATIDRINKMNSQGKGLSKEARRLRAQKRTDAVEESRQQTLLERDEAERRRNLD